MLSSWKVYIMILSTAYNKYKTRGNLLRASTSRVEIAWTLTFDLCVIAYGIELPW